MLICLHIVYGNFHTTEAELSSAIRDYMVLQTWNNYYMALYSKSLPTQL